MPLVKVHNKEIILPDYGFKNKYWPVLSQIIYKEIGEKEITIPTEVQQQLKGCFSYLIEEFSLVLGAQLNASFFIFCQYLHENSIELWKMQLEGIELGINQEDFAGTRRILKIIIEQATKNDLVGCANFKKEIDENLPNYISVLEELLYIGIWSVNISEFIARSQLFLYSIGIKIEREELNILTYQPYPALYEFVFEEMPKHNSDVELMDSMPEFKEILTNRFNVSYDTLSGFTGEIIKNPEYKFGAFKIENLIDIINKQFNYDKKFLSSFYSGLTVDRLNCLSIEKCILNNQDSNRYMYRPIVELTIDNEKYNIVGYNKWLESFTTLSTNALPFGIYPEEWKEYKEIRDFVNHLSNSHDKVLEDPVKKIIDEAKLPYDFNLASFQRLNGNNVNITQTVGDIDILFIDSKNKIIYICECKHNRSRFDMNNWRRDYSNFKKKYEIQLERKVNWTKNHIELIGEHFKKRFDLDFNPSLETYDVRGIFIINAPTIYMFNGNYKAFTIHDIKLLVKDKYKEVSFLFKHENSGEEFLIEHPYFDNLKIRKSILMLMSLTIKELNELEGEINFLLKTK